MDLIIIGRDDVMANTECSEILKTEKGNARRCASPFLCNYYITFSVKKQDL